MKIGIIGSGEVGRALGTGFLGSGHEVRIGTRTPKNPELVAWVQKAGNRASIGTPSETARGGELLVLAVMGSAAEEAIRAAGADQFAGKTVIDVTNPLVMSDQGPPSLFVGHTDSLGERVQRALPAAHVVKAFNIVGNPYMVHPKLPGGPPDMFISGNDAGAKAEVTRILHDFGWPSVIDLGGIEGSRLLESLCLLWVTSAMRLGSWDIAFRLLRK
jgi:8-hydroxy-5-deazaflavin:NADPH oxidoreductase